MVAQRRVDRRLRRLTQANPMPKLVALHCRKFFIAESSSFDAPPKPFQFPLSTLFAGVPLSRHKVVFTRNHIPPPAFWLVAGFVHVRDVVQFHGRRPSPIGGA
jgi:hypothetical protein